jgi:hypothetical protein
MSAMDIRSVEEREIEEEEKRKEEEAAGLHGYKIGEEARLHLLNWRYFVHCDKQEGWEPKEKVLHPQLHE